MVKMVRPRIGVIKPRVVTSVPDVAPEGARWGSGRGGRPWRRKREAVLKRDEYLCKPCRRSQRLTLATQVDHITPRAQGGSDDDENLEAICDACQDAKRAIEAAEGRRRRR